MKSPFFSGIFCAKKKPFICVERESLHSLHKHNIINLDADIDDIKHAKNNS